MTRGHLSHINVGFVIECETGFVINFEVVCNHCVICAKHKKKLTAASFNAWYETHKDKCDINFDGKSGF